MDITELYPTERITYNIQLVKLHPNDASSH